MTQLEVATTTTDTIRRDLPVDIDSVCVGGSWRTSSIDTRISVIDPTTEEPAGTVVLAGPAEIEDALAAARESFDAGVWRSATVETRARALEQLADRLDARVEELAVLNVRELGTPITSARGLQSSPIGLLRKFAQELRELDLSDTRARSTGAVSEISRQPVGVVLGIVPWNTPTNQFTFKVGPALAAGCSVVVKAATRAPLVLSAIADTIVEMTEEGIFPPGVFSLLVCERELGERLISDPRVDFVSFTGSTEAGRRVGALASANLAHVAMELGGKSAAVVLEDADIAQTVGAVGMSAIRNAGQTCVAITRILVPQSRHDEVVDALAEVYDRVTLGDPDDPGTDIGPVSSAQARSAIQEHIRAAQAEGAVVVRGGAESPDRTGYFVTPTILDAVTPDMVVAREEIFGPVVSIMTYDDEDDAVRIANDTAYGLSGAVFAGTDEHARAVAGRIRSGVVGVNCATFDATVPFGGMKASGVGREGGREGLEEYFETQTFHLPR